MIRIAHCADIQILNNHRHEEFAQHFENFYKSLRENGVDLIILAGDIFQHKNSLSPEAWRLGSRLFYNLAKIAPTIIIPGNHDTTLVDTSRLDIITPILESLNDPRLIYLKNSQVFQYNENVEFVVFSCLDENWPTKKDTNKDKISLGLYHGMVKGAVLQNGQVVEDCPYELNQFLDIVDYLMMGDVHKNQILDHQFRAAYPGSLIQQNFGESTQKGYLIWDIEDKTTHDVNFVELPNICPYYTLEIPDDLRLNEDLPLQKQARIRIISRQLTLDEEQDLRQQTKKAYGPKKVIFKEKEGLFSNEVKISKKFKTEDLRNIVVQENLIREFLKQYGESYDLERIFEINRVYNQAVSSGDDENLRNVKYKYKNMWWSNLFSYDENHSFDFEKKKGTVGIWGGNKVGKSATIVDIPLYIHFNTNSKNVTKNTNVVNDKKDFCSGGMNIELDDKIYTIKRETSSYIKSGKKNKNPVYQGKTDVSFEVIHPGGKKENKTGKERADTDKTIRSIFGEAEDFMDTSVAPQWKLLGFIEKGPTERQKILSRYFDIDIFEKKKSLANNKFKELRASLKIYEKKELNSSFDSKQEKLAEFLKNKKSLEKEKGVLISKIEKIDNKLASTLEEIVHAGSSEKVSLNEIQEEIKKRQFEISDKKNQLTNLNLEQKKIEEKYKQFCEEPRSLEGKELEKQARELAKTQKDLAKEEKTLLQDVGKLQVVHRNLEEFKGYTCLNNSDCCMLKEKQRLEAEREKLQKKQKNLTNLQIELKITLDKLEEIKGITECRQKLDDLRQSHQEVLEICALLEEKLVIAQKKEKDIEKNKLQAEKNKKLIAKTEMLKEEKQTLEGALAQTEKSLNQSQVSIEILQHETQELKKEIEDYEETKKEYNAYDYFMRAMGKNGIPKIIIDNNLSIINRQIRKILFEKVDFWIEVDTSGSILFYEPNHKPRIVELCSGMEKTLASIALRAALISITSLPKSNIFVLDEVFSSLDPKYTEATREILEHLKSMFDVVFIITHIESIKDFCDHFITIKKENGFAKIS